MILNDVNIYLGLENEKLNITLGKEFVPINYIYSKPYSLDTIGSMQFKIYWRVKVNYSKESQFFIERRMGEV